MNKNSSIRVLKKEIIRVLERSGDYNELLRISGGSLLTVINGLFSFLYHKDPVIKWNAVNAMGEAVSALAEKEAEPARNIIRRLMWNLNDESGGIGWGSAEAMGEILARSSILAKEYVRILFSYARKDGSFQENFLMQRGVLWGIGRFCEAWPEIADLSAAEYIMPFLYSDDAFVRGFAVRIMGSLMAEIAKERITELKNDKSPVQIFLKGILTNTCVKELAEEAVVRINTCSNMQAGSLT